MLPVIDLRLADYCRVAFNYCIGVSLPIGYSLWFDGDEVQRAGKELNLNLDEYLMALLTLLAPQEARVLTFYAAIPGRFSLSLCSSGPLDFLHDPDIRTALPGLLNLRHDFIPQTAAPFLLCEGSALYRLHPLTQPGRTSFYFWDFGDYVGNFLKEVDKAFYFRILNDKQTYFGYSVVPKNPCTAIIHRGGVIPVHHAFCQVT
jgi:hypothetical protein